MALDAGAALMANLASGITGDEVSKDKIKTTLSEITSGAEIMLSGLKGSGEDVFSWIKDNGDILSPLASSLAGEFAILQAASHPLAAGLTTVGLGIATLSTDWDAFERKSPELVELFESLSGIEFDSFKSGVNSITESLNEVSEWFGENRPVASSLLALAGGSAIAAGHIATGAGLMGIAVNLAEEQADAFAEEIQAIEDSAAKMGIEPEPVSVFGFKTGAQLPGLEAVGAYYNNGSPLYTQNEIQNALDEITHGEPVSIPVSFTGPNGEEIPLLSQTKSDLGLSNTPFETTAPILAGQATFDSSLSFYEDLGNMEDVFGDVAKEAEAISAAVEHMEALAAAAEQSAAAAVTAASALAGAKIVMDGVTVGELILPTISAGIYREIQAVYKK